MSNYSATIVTLDALEKLDQFDNLRRATIFGLPVLVGAEHKRGELGIYFPPESQLSEEFAAANNLYRDASLNADKTAKPGFLEPNRRVKTIRLKQVPSAGLWLPMSALDYLPEPTRNKLFVNGVSFEELDGHPICKKYIRNVSTFRLPKSKVVRRVSVLVRDQFRVHYDTENLRRYPFYLTPEETVVITEKFHGSAGVIANLLVQKNPSLFERFLSWCGVSIEKSRYARVWGSRWNIKGVEDIDVGAKNWYDSDVWALPHVPTPPPGFSVYGEVVGFTPSGSPVQKHYAYGCQPGEAKFFVYRVTLTNVSGIAVELGWEEVVNFCLTHGYETVPHLRTIRLSEYLPWFVEKLGEWQRACVEKLDREFGYDAECIYNPGQPREGVAVRLGSTGRILKLKSLAFLEKESKLNDDAANVNLEEQEEGSMTSHEIHNLTIHEIHSSTRNK